MCYHSPTYDTRNLDSIAFAVFDLNNPLDFEIF